MQILKLAVLFVISFVSSFLLFALVLPSRFNISQFIEIERSKESVFNILKKLEERKNWYTIVDSNQVSTIQISGEGDNGSKFTWNNGEVEVVLSDIKKIENKVKFINYPINAGFMKYNLNTTGTETFDLMETQHRTTVTWTLTGGPLGYPMGKVVMAAVRYKLYQQMQKSLNKLKDYIENTQMVDTPKETNTNSQQQFQQQQQQFQQQEQEQQQEPQSEPNNN